MAPEAPSDEPRLAGLGYRAAARVVDLFFVLLLFLVVGTIAAAGLEPDALRSGYVADVIVFGVAAAYEVIPTGLWGRTAGKAILRLRVVRLPDLGRPGMSRSFIRFVVPATAGYVLGSIPPPWGYLTGLLVLAVYLYAIVDPRRQGLHDKAAGTIVTTERASVSDAIMRP